MVALRKMCVRITRSGSFFLRGYPQTRNRGPPDNAPSIDGRRNGLDFVMVKIVRSSVSFRSVVESKSWRIM